MIGVLADKADLPAVREFFELFKTPWELYRSGRPYEVLISSGAELPETSATLVFVYAGKRTPFDQARNLEMHSPSCARILSYKGDRVPIYGSSVTFRGAGPHALVDEINQDPAALEIASDNGICVRVGFDLFQEVRHLLTTGQPKAYAASPTVELHIAFIRDKIISYSVPLVEIPAVPSGHRFIACLTHDVDHAAVRNYKWDHTMFGFLYRALVGSLIDFCRKRRSLKQVAVNWRAAFSLPFVHLGLARDFWDQFEAYLKIEGDLASTFFVIPERGNSGEDASGSRRQKRAARYDLAQIRDSLRRLLSMHCEIGVHGIEAWRDTLKGVAEFARIQQLTGMRDIGVRMHWLFFSEHSPVLLEKAGFSYDSTVGYNETVGYRAGTAQAFKPLPVDRMLELPLHIMDTALFFPSHMNLSAKQAHAAVAPLIENAVRFGGVLTVNWHDRSLAPERLWGDFYVKLLATLRSDEPWFATGSQAVSWFRKRRSASIESVTREGDCVRIKVSLDQRNDELPALRLRVHHARPGKPRVPQPAELGVEFTDFSFDQSNEILVAA